MTDMKSIGDAAAGITAFAAVLDWLPTVAAGLTVLWYSVRFAEWIVTKCKKE
jgi:hypothetical protein